MHNDLTTKADWHEIAGTKKEVQYCFGGVLIFTHTVIAATHQAQQQYKPR